MTFITGPAKFFGLGLDDVVATLPIREPCDARSPGYDCSLHSGHEGPHCYDLRNAGTHLTAEEFTRRYGGKDD